MLDKRCLKINLQIRADNKEAINFYNAVGYDEDEVTSFGKRLIEDWAINLQSTGTTALATYVKRDGKFLLFGISG